MKRVIPAVACITALTIASIVLAQGGGRARLRSPSGEKSISIVQMDGLTFVAADEVAAALGGTVTPDSQGFKIVLNGIEGVFGTDSRFGVVKEELIEMPAVPALIDGRPFVPWQFFQGYLRASGLDVAWEPAEKVLTIAPERAETLTVSMSVVALEGFSKLVIQLSGKADYTLTREPGRYIVRLRNPLRAAFTEQTFENPHISRVVIGANEVIINLTGESVVADSYKLDNPYRVVLDLRKGVAPVVPPATRPGFGSPRSNDPPGIRTIVLDPGHGGKEVGAIGPNGIMEKDMTLAICQRLATLLNQRLGARVILTRTDDSVISLDQRTAIANQYKADLFLSVHANASLLRGARGSETYFLSLDASDDLARKAAERENELSASASQAAQGASSDLRLILWDLAQQDYLKESSRLAELVQEEMSKATGVQNRGVKQAPFKVLVGATMPAALLEVGFISNPDEETKLKDQGYQSALAISIANAIDRYKGEYETRLGMQQSKTAPMVGGGAAPAPAEKSKGESSH